jgi:MFS family permease
VSLRPPPPPPDSPLAALGDRRAILDTGLGPIVFVVANAIWGLHTAAYAALGLAALVAVVRLVRREPVTNAIGGVLGTGLAVFIALRSGHASGYFVPRMLYAAALAVVFAVSAAIGRPLIGYLIMGFWRLPPDWLRHPGARRACAEITFAWAALFALRAIVYAILIPIGSTGALAAASIVMGWPAFGLLLFFSYRYLPRRLSQLGAPLPHGHGHGDPPSEPTPSPGDTRT